MSEVSTFWSYEWTSKRTKDWSERVIERNKANEKNKLSKETKELKSEPPNERTTGVNVRLNERKRTIKRNEGTKERMNERTNERTEPKK